MPAQETADVTLSWPVVAGGVLAVLSIIGATIAGLAKAYRMLVRSIQREVGVPARAAAHQLATSNGRTVGQYVEAASADIASLKAMVLRNEENSLSALALAKDTGERLDRHIVTGHGKE